MSRTQGGVIDTFLAPPAHPVLRPIPPTLGGLIYKPQLSASPHQLNEEGPRANGRAVYHGCLNTWSKHLGSLWPISGCGDTDVSFSPGETGRRFRVPRAAIQPVRLTPQPPSPTPPSQRRSAHLLSDQATAPSLLRSPPSVARPISPPEAPPPTPPCPGRLRRGGAGQRSGTDAPPGLQVPAATGARPRGRGYTGQRIERSPGAQARERVWPIAGRLGQCAVGGGEKPARAGTKAGSRAAAGGWNAPGSGGVWGPVDRVPRTGFRREVSGGRLLSRDGPHLVQSFLPPSPNPEPPPPTPASGSRALPAPAWKF